MDLPNRHPHVEVGTHDRICVTSSHRIHETGSYVSYVSLIFDINSYG